MTSAVSASQPQTPSTACASPSAAASPRAASAVKLSPVKWVAGVSARLSASLSSLQGRFKRLKGSVRGRTSRRSISASPGRRSEESVDQSDLSHRPSSVLRQSPTHPPQLATAPSYEDGSLSFSASPGGSFTAPRPAAFPNHAPSPSQLFSPRSEPSYQPAAEAHPTPHRQTRSERPLESADHTPISSFTSISGQHAGAPATPLGPSPHMVPDGRQSTPTPGSSRASGYSPSNSSYSHTVPSHLPTRAGDDPSSPSIRAATGAYGYPPPRPGAARPEPAAAGVAMPPAAAAAIIWPVNHETARAGQGNGRDSLDPQSHQHLLSSSLQRSCPPSAVPATAGGGGGGLAGTHPGMAPVPWPAPPARFHSPSGNGSIASSDFRSVSGAGEGHSTRTSPAVSSAGSGVSGFNRAVEAPGVLGGSMGGSQNSGGYVMRMSSPGATSGSSSGGAMSPAELARLSPQVQAFAPPSLREEALAHGWRRS